MTSKADWKLGGGQCPATQANCRKPNMGIPILSKRDNSRT
jgi:hypothetical protein